MMRRLHNISELRSGRIGLIAVTVLFVGVWIYVAERPANTIPFLAAINISHIAPTIFGGLGNSLPTFAHVFSFSIFTALLLGNVRNAPAIGCLSWLFINLALEISQHRLVSPLISDGFGQQSMLGRFSSYGTFDLADLLAAALGALAGYTALVRHAK